MFTFEVDFRVIWKYTFIVIVIPAVVSKYKPNWDSLDGRPLPSWYDKAKIGIFLHWGIYSVPSFGNEWFWKRWKDGEPEYVNFMQKNYRPGFTYQDFGPHFQAEFFDPKQWVNLFQDAGARYVILTSKHHEGFTMWPSKYSWGWNSMDVGPARDFCGELATALKIHTPNIHFGLYHSLLEWFNPILKEDELNFFATNYFPTNKTIPELKELIKKYKPEIIWSDGDWIGTPEYWESQEFLAWLFNDSPVKETVVVNDRWGLGTNCQHGSYFICSDNYDPGEVMPFKWETCISLDTKSWGFRRNAPLADYLTITDILHRLAKTISLGGNFLLNAGPTSDGRIPPLMEERLRQMGEWLLVNGEAVYESRPWKYQNDSITNNVWFTERGQGKMSFVYCMVLDWPQLQELHLARVKPTSKTIVKMLGHKGKLKFTEDDKSKGLRIQMPNRDDVKSDIVWTLKFKNVEPNLP